MNREDYSSVIEKVPEYYFSPDCPELGDVEEFVYGTSFYAGDNRPLLKPCYVYTPFGYNPEDPDTRYDILYFMHGFLCNANSTFEGDGGAIGNLFDWLIYEKKTKPFLAVALTWDYENEVRDFDLSYKQVLQFHQEFRKDILPAVEEKYHTYAQTTDAKGLRESRAHRAFAGYSMGAVTTWQMFLYGADYVKLFAPLACDCWEKGHFAGAQQPKETAALLATVPTLYHMAPEDYTIYCGVGDKDRTVLQMVPQIFEMWNYEPEDPAVLKPFNRENLSLHLDEGKTHGAEACEDLLGALLPVFFG